MSVSRCHDYPSIILLEPCLDSRATWPFLAKKGLLTSPADCRSPVVIFILLPDRQTLKDFSMSHDNSVTHWLDGLKAGDDADIQRLWDRYFQLFSRLDDVMLRVIAFQKLQGMSADEIAGSLEISKRTVDRKTPPDPCGLGGGTRMQPPMTPIAGLPVAEMQQIDAACDRFEAAWRAGERPRMESFLRELSGPAQARLFHELLDLELDFRIQTGEQPERRLTSNCFPNMKKSSVPFSRRETSRRFSARVRNPGSA